MIAALAAALAAATAGAAPSGGPARPVATIPAPGAARPAAAAVGVATTPAEPAIARLAHELARAAARIAPPERTVLGVTVEAPAAPALAAAIQARLVAELGAAGFRGAFASRGREAAEAEGADAHLRVAVELGGDLAAAGDLAPVRVNFFTGRPTGPGGLVSAAVAADREAGLLARAGPAPLPAAGMFEVARWIELPAPPLAIAAGDLDGDGRAEAAVLDASAVRVFGADGASRAAWPLPSADEGALPVRDPPGAIAVVDGRVRWQAPALDRAGSLRLEGGALVEESSATAAGPAPLAAGAAGLLAAPWRAGTNAFGPSLSRGEDEAVAAGPCVAVAAAPSPGPFAFALALDDGRVEFLGPDLAPAATLDGAGAAVALADLGGDGVALAVVSSPSFEAPDRVRVFALAPGAPPVLRFESADLPARLLAGAAGDLDGDGRAEALVAGPASGGGAVIFLVREARR